MKLHAIRRSLIDSIPPTGKLSIEQHLFPKWICAGKEIRAIESSAVCVDIGTPERYREAQVFLAGVER
jgi:NDP-sugar pyrophosphorylase family protein